MQIPAWKRVIPSVENSGGGAWFSTLLYCAFAFGLFYFALFRWRDLVPILITGFFAACGVVALLLALVRTLERMKFGDVRIALEGAPPALGGVLAGRIQLPAAAAAARHIRAELQCVEEVMGQDSKGRTTKSEKRVWYREAPFPVRREGARSIAAFQIRIADEPVIERAVAYKWQLNVRVELPGVDLSRSFPIEVAQPPAAAVEPASVEKTPAAMLLVEEPPASAGASGWVLVAANLVPLAGVAFWGWKVGDVVLLYWFENLVIGAMNVLRIAAADPQHVVSSPHGGTGIKPRELPIAKLALIGFFVVHYGAFCAIHGTILAELFPFPGPHGQRLGIGGVVAELLREPALLAAIFALVCSHLVSFRVNYIGREEYRHVNIARLMAQPYRRIVVVHLFIIFGGLALAASKAPAAAAIAVFVVIKTAIDFNMHLRERRVLAA